MIKRTILRIVAIVIIIAGFRFAWNSRKPVKSVSTEQEYSQKMAELSSRYNAIEREGETANQNAVAQAGTNKVSAAEMLSTLDKIHAEKDKYIADLQALDVPKRYEEAHATFLAWKKQEQETEGKLIEGYKQFSAGKKDVETKIDDLIKAGDKMSKDFEDKLSGIAKKNGFDSFQRFLNQRPTVESNP